MIRSTASTGNKLYIAIWIVNNTGEIELDLSLSFHRITGLLVNNICMKRTLFIHS